MSAHAAPSHIQMARAALRERRSIGGAITRTASFNVLSSAAAALGGVIIARALGPSVRGDYAAITAWFGMLLAIGEMGQSAAICYHVAHDPQQAQDYVASSRSIMLITGIFALLAAIVVSPLLARGHSVLLHAYQIAFAGSVIAFVSTSYTYSLQARSIGDWNKVRLSQPLLSVVAMIVLWRLRLLSLTGAIDILVGTTLLQLGYAYYWCRRTELAPGQTRRQLMRPLARYGATQLAAIAPYSINLFLDRLLLSLLASPADLGRYAVASSIALVPIPLVSAIGNVAFPRLAAQRHVTAESHRLQRGAVLVSAGLATAILLPIAVSATWVIPLVFGPAFRGAVPLLWMLTPGGVFLSCSQVVSDLLRGRNRPGFVAISQGLAAVFTVVLLIALLPVAGVAGAAIASSVAYGVALIAMVQCLRRLPHEAPRPAAPSAGLRPLRGRAARRSGSPEIDRCDEA
ncbi:MAG TPA: oligosaccharide flippase family protein [Trebonia sp.]|nr:oligosaccharide flippase family protein [Trebonia sp.]